MAVGMTGILVSVAILKLPFLNGLVSGPLYEVPSGKSATGMPFLTEAFILFMVAIRLCSSVRETKMVLVILAPVFRKGHLLSSAFATNAAGVSAATIKISR